MPSEAHLRDVNELLGQLRGMREERDDALAERDQLRVRLSAANARACAEESFALRTLAERDQARRANRKLRIVAFVLWAIATAGRGAGRREVAATVRANLERSATVEANDAE